MVHVCSRRGDDPAGRRSRQAQAGASWCRQTQGGAKEHSCEATATAGGEAQSLERGNSLQPLKLFFSAALPRATSCRLFRVLDRLSFLCMILGSLPGAMSLSSTNDTPFARVDDVSTTLSVLSAPSTRATSGVGDQLISPGLSVSEPSAGEHSTASVFFMGSAQLPGMIYDG